MKRIAGIAGALIAFACVLWIFYESWGQLPTLDLNSPLVWRNLGIGVALYVFSQVLGAMAWRGTLWSLGSGPVAGLAESEMMVSQIGKYIPGNVAHLIGRLALARSDGVATWVISLSMFLEIAMLLGVGILYVACLMLSMPDTMNRVAHELHTRSDLVYALAAVMLLLLVAGFVALLLQRRRAGGRIEGKVHLPRLVVPVMLYALIFAILGASLYFVSRAVIPAEGPPMGFCMIVFVTAWVTGFVTPGAPGGIGVRDGIIALGLGMTMAAPMALGIALLHRAVSIIGDVMIFGIGVLLRRHFAPPAESGLL
ncbi:flippase-like domain-containing protein [Rhodobacteraceae bacterium NNCM2]|nr:flippase-like domain-containing protein [Coraliihabitans acroporae]